MIVAVVGSGTDIGKTWVAAHLLRALKERGIAASPLKPVASGFDPAHPDDSDAAALLRAIGASVTAEAIASVSPWRFQAPLSPHAAARREGATLRFSDLLAVCMQRAQQGPTLIETAGGIMTPLTDDATCLDLVAALQARCVLVVGAGLGTLSYTLTAHAALKGRGIDVLAILVNEVEPGPMPVEETAATLRRFVDIPVRTVVRDASDDAVDTALQPVLFALTHPAATTTPRDRPPA